MRIDRLMIMAAAFAATGSMAQAAICDYRPSQLIGGDGGGRHVLTDMPSKVDKTDASTQAVRGATTAAGVGGAAAGAVGVGMKAAGYYTLVHASSGLTMLGSTAAGASGAGTVGIIGGTAGFIGTVASIVMAPATIVAAGVTTVVVGSYEGACYYLVDERITDYAEIDVIVQDLGRQADPEYFQYHEANSAVETDAYIQVRNDKGEWDGYKYYVRDLYIVNGLLKHRDWGLNTVIGQVGVRSEAAEVQ
ncbi:hypothetical protein [Paracoccus sp. (in: a-proteobacteria)]